MFRHFVFVTTTAIVVAGPIAQCTDGSCPRTEGRASAGDGEDLALLQLQHRRKIASEPEPAADVPWLSELTADSASPCGTEPSAATRSVLEAIQEAATANPLSEALFSAPEQTLGAILKGEPVLNFTLLPVGSIGAGPSPPAVNESYNPWGFCPLKNDLARLDAARKVGGAIRVVAQMFNEFNAWIWSDGEKRPINPATDYDLYHKGPLGASVILPSWADLRSAGLLFALLPSFVATDSGNRTSWFLQSAQATCWNPAPLALGPMIFRYPQAAGELSDPGQRRGYYTATIGQVEDFFERDVPLFLDGDRHFAFRQILELSAFARRYTVSTELARRIPAEEGCTTPGEETIAGYVGPLVMQAIWGHEATEAATAAMTNYAKFGKFSIFGTDIHKVLKPVGIAGQIRSARETVSAWAQDTPFAAIILKARDHLFSGSPWFLSDKGLIDVITTATLFAGLVGTTDMATKCVANQKRDARHQALFKDNPEMYLIELMRFDSAVTSVTELLSNNQTINLEGRNLQLLEGTPVQVVLATANRDPAHWIEPEAFNPKRPDLFQTLSWNGKVADVEARSFRRAPRYCPGYCLSLKVGAAVCAAVMGSFEELLAAGKILKDNGNVKCNNFGPHKEVPIWEPPTAPMPAPWPPIAIDHPVLVREGAECNSPGYYVGDFSTLDECADAVKGADGKFFIYGKGLIKKGWCYIEYTTSDQCPEGFQWDDYDFYDIPNIPLEDTITGHANVVEVSVNSGAGSTLGAGILERSQLVDSEPVLAEMSGKVDHSMSFVWDRYCNREYRLGVYGGASVVKHREACCDASVSGSWVTGSHCTIPSRLEEAGQEILTGDQLTWEKCVEPEDSSFFLPVSSMTYQPLTVKPAVNECLKVRLASQTISLRQVVNECPTWLVAVVDSMGTQLAVAWKAFVNRNEDPNAFFLLEDLLQKDPMSSTFDPDTFDSYTIAMFISVVHLNGRTASGSTLSAVHRIALPTEMRYLDRYTVYTFLGVPQEEIDGNKSGSMGIIEACVVDVTRNLDILDYEHPFDALGPSGSDSNAWNKILGHVPNVPSNCPRGLVQCTKEEFIRGTFEAYSDGSDLPLYPAPRVNFAERWLVNGNWKDEGETWLGWQHYGAHHLTASDVKGTAFKLSTTVLAGLAIRAEFGVMGADMFFDSSEAPVMIQTPGGDQLWRSEVDSKTWQYWKFVWRSSLFLMVTLVDHLWATHFSAANSMAGAAREALPAAHPFRRLMTMLTFGTVNVNSKAFHQLLGYRALLQRSSPFSDWSQVANVAQASVPSLKKRFGPFVNSTYMRALPKAIRMVPFYEDGKPMFDAVRRFTDAFFDLYPEWCQDGLLADEEMLLYFKRIEAWSLFTQHREEDDEFLGFFGPGGHAGGKIQCSGAKMWLAVHAFHVTAYHRHVGFVAESAANPDWAGFSFKEGERFTRPRQAVQLSLIAQSTATRWPKINEDFSFLVNGMDRAGEARKVFSNFRADLGNLKRLVDRRNEDRTIPYVSMDPSEVECSVAV